MKAEILGIKPPLEYKEGLINYREGLDNYPDYLELIKAGYSPEEANKMLLLIRIEAMKYSGVLAIEDKTADSEEIQIIESEISEMIKEYNNI